MASSPTPSPWRDIYNHPLGRLWEEGRLSPFFFEGKEICKQFLDGNIDRETFTKRFLPDILKVTKKGLVLQEEDLRSNELTIESLVSKMEEDPGFAECYRMLVPRPRTYQYTNAQIWEIETDVSYIRFARWIFRDVMKALENENGEVLDGNLQADWEDIERYLADMDETLHERAEYVRKTCCELDNVRYEE